MAIKCLSYSPRKLQEAFQAAQRLKKLNQRSLPKYIDVFCADSKLYLVSKYISGASLETLLLERRRCPTEEECLRIAKELLGALTYLTDQKPSLVHGGIAPKSVFLQEGSYGGRAYLLGEDLCLGREMEDPKGVIYTPLRDIYDLGVTLWSLISGCIVAPGSDAQLKLYFEKKDTSPEFVSLLRQMLDTDPSTRISAEDAWKRTITLTATTSNPPTPVTRIANGFSKYFDLVVFCVDSRGLGMLSQRRMKRPKPPNARSELLRDDSSSLEIFIPSEGLANKRSKPQSTSIPDLVLPVPGILLGAGSIILALLVLALLLAIVIQVLVLDGGGTYLLRFHEGECCVGLLTGLVVGLVCCVVALTFVGFAFYRFLRESLTMTEVEITNTDFIVRSVFRALKEASIVPVQREDHTNDESQNQQKTKPDFFAKTQDMSRARVRTPCIALRTLLQIEDAREWDGDCLILLECGRTRHRFGKGLLKQEQEWLIDEINEFLELSRTGV